MTQALAAFETTFGARVPDRMRLDSQAIYENAAGSVDSSLSGDDTYFNGSTDAASVAGVATTVGQVVILPGPDGVLDSSASGGEVIRPYVRAVIVEPVSGGNGTCDTTAESGDVQVVPSGNAAYPGQILVMPGPDGRLGTSPSTDDVMLHDAWYTRTFDASSNEYTAAVDLNGSAATNGNLDTAECLYYFLCTTWKKDPAPATQFTAQTFGLNYVNQPAGFEFIPPPWMRRTDGGPLLDVPETQVLDTDDDGYLELCDVWGNPLRYVADVPAIVVEPAQSTGTAGNAPQTAAAGDDRQLCPAGNYAAAGTWIVHPGDDWILQTTTLTGNDILTHNRLKGRAGLVYSIGPNGIDNLGFDDQEIGEGREDDDADGIDDNEDDINNM